LRASIIGGFMFPLVFAPAFVVVSIILAASAYFFWQMPDDAGHEISGRKAIAISSRKAPKRSPPPRRTRRPRTRGISG
jgi:hypothetical protein